MSAYAGSVDVWDLSVAEEDEGDEGYQDVVSKVDIPRRRNIDFVTDTTHQTVV